MKSHDPKTLMLQLAPAGLASAAPNAFPLSQMGYGSLHQLAIILVLPATGALLLAWITLAWSGRATLAWALARGAFADLVATLALEAVRYPGSRLWFMPGNLPQLMGGLLLDRFALGPSMASNIVGFAYHFWNGARASPMCLVTNWTSSDGWGFPCLARARCRATRRPS